MSVDDLIPETPPVQPQVWAATVLDTAGSLADKVRVLVPGFDGGETAHGPCPWMPRGEDLPTRGDTAIVAIDDEGNEWIVGWWPA